jgi:hypothetical protein
MAIDPQELELRATFFKERLLLQDRHQTEAKALQADQQARFKAFKAPEPSSPPSAPHA